MEFFINMFKAIRYVKRLGASNVFLMLGSNLVQAAAAVTQFDPTIRGATVRSVRSVEKNVPANGVGRRLLRLLLPIER